MLYNYPLFGYLQEYDTITILLQLPFTFAAFPLFTHKAMTMASIAEAPMEEFYP